MDRFLTEICHVHDLRASVRGLSDTERSKLIRNMVDLEGVDSEAGDWIFEARDAQVPPRDLDWAWLFLGGRGTGKTRDASACVHMAARAGIKRIHLIGPTVADLHDVNLTKRRLEWPNGGVAVLFSGEEAESLRGPQAEFVVIDEIARMRYQEHVFDMAMLGLRLGDKPRMFIMTTPRPTPFIKRLVKMDGVSITTGSIYDNAEHLSADFIKKIRELYEGTRLGRQGLQGALILDPINAMFKDDWLQHDDVPEELIEQVSIGVDPSGGGDEVGIVVGALLIDGRLAVLADRTISATPGQWGDEVVRAHDEFDADDVVVEVNFGGDMATEVIKAAADRAHRLGKTRLEPDPD